VVVGVTQGNKGLVVVVIIHLGVVDVTQQVIVLEVI
jgi:hypothetical protein